MKTGKFRPYVEYIEYDETEMQARSDQFYKDNQRRRTIRQFSDRPVSREIIENCLKTAGTAPSGANKQPWHFVVVSSSEIKKQIRQAAEEEETKFYDERAPKEWLEAIAPLGTDASKPFLEQAPYLIVIFEEKYKLDENQQKLKNYYTSESVGIATGLLIAAIHNAGLVSLTHTPSPMKFLEKILNRPENEKAYMILVVGYPSHDAEVPKIYRKELPEISTFI